MQLIYPIGLLALAGLIIPVLIHLWSVKRGRTIKIGSIALLGENATTSSKSIKLTDILLFALRCILLILIAWMLAQPYLNEDRMTSKNKGWILIDKTQVSNTYQIYRKTIDSLLNIGFELHDFNLGFVEFSLGDSAVATKGLGKLKYNSLLNQLNQEIPSGYSAYLFADHKLNNFDGNLPQLNFKLVWKELKFIDTVKTWSSTFLHKIYDAKSTPSLTIYSADQAQNPPVVKIMIYDPKGIDSKYIKAGIYAISNFTKRKIEIIKSSKEADLIFWLSDKAIIPEKPKQQARLFSYQYGKVEAVNSVLQIGGESTHMIALTKRIASNTLKGTTIWKDGYGEPILLKEGNHFYFYSRFDPQWSDLVWDEQFVKALLPIVLGNQNHSNFGFENHDDDQRLLPETHFAISKNNLPSFSTAQPTKNIDYMIWILAFVVLTIERIVSYRHKNMNYGKR